ncbi:MAG: DUF5777 family beta-barrel protein [Chitinophagaceae bacterium]
MNFKKIIFFIFSFICFEQLYAQDSSLLKMLNDSVRIHSVTGYVFGTFKGTHIINQQTIEAPAGGALNLIIMHRFGPISGTYNFFGLDNATIRIGLDYGITNRLAIGIGRSSLDKILDGYVKYKIFRQTDGSTMPISLSFLEVVTNHTDRIGKTLSAADRTAYASEFLIARKFNKFSLQLTPGWLHFNAPPLTADANDIFSLGFGARVKITKRMSITGEYNYFNTNEVAFTKVYNSYGLAWEIETGGHVFQLVLTNAQHMIEPYFIARTTSSKDIYFGFNITRNFNISKHAKHSVSGWQK